MTKTFLFLALLLVLLPGRAPRSQVQWPLPPAPAVETPDAAASLADPETERVRVAAHLREAQAQLAEARRALAAVPAPPGAAESQALEQRISALQARIQVGRRYLQTLDDVKSVREERQRLQAELDTHDGTPEAAATTLEQVEGLARRLRAEQAATKTDELRLASFTLQLARFLWKGRLELHEHWDFAAAREWLKALGTLREPLAQGVAASQLARDECETFAVGPRFAAPELAAPRDALVQATAARAGALVVTLQSAREARDLLDLWQEAIEVRLGDQGTAGQVRGWTEVLRGYLGRLWSYELVAVEDRLTLDGQVITERRPVSVGKVIKAFVILGVGLLVASGLAGLISRVVLPFSRGRPQARLLIQKVLHLALIALVVVLALITVKIPLAALAFLGGAIALGIGFGAKNLLNNFISGFILIGEGTVRPGDRIEIEGTRGIVEGIGARSTRVRRLDGVDLLIPNSQFLESSVTNMTLSDQHLRIAIQVGAAYGSPTRQVEALLLQIAHGHALIVAKPAPVVVFEDFGDSALVFRLYVWIDLAAQDDYRAVVTELRHRIAEGFAEHGFTMPFPQRDLHLALAGPIPVRVDGPGGADPSTRPPV